MYEKKSLSAMLREEATDPATLPYERFLTYGGGALTDTELLAIILRTGSRNMTPMEIARRVLSLQAEEEGGRGGSLNCLYHLGLSELVQIEGIGQIKAVKLLCIAELAKRMAAQRAAERLCFDRPERVAAYYMEGLRHEERERVLLLSLTSRLELIEEHTISLGTVNRSLLSPREVFARALKAGAVHILLLHNHPGGNPEPSRADLEISRRIAELGFLMDISLTDHIIIGDGTYVSLRERGLLLSEERQAGITINR